MKEVELRLISELMKNSRRSDRDLARILGCSQPTVTRMRRKLEEEGIIKEYTIVPDFRMLGFEIMAMTFVKFSYELTRETVEQVIKAGRELEKNCPNTTIMILQGLGLEYDGVFISFHEDYASFLKVIEIAKQLPFLDVEHLASFLVSLPEHQYRHLTFSVLADYLLKSKGKKGIRHE